MFTQEVVFATTADLAKLPYQVNEDQRRIQDFSRVGPKFDAYTKKSEFCLKTLWGTKPDFFYNHQLLR